jgi:hypothetical protein
MRKYANFSPYMRRPLVIYDFAPDSSEFPHLRGKFDIFFSVYFLGKTCIRNKFLSILKLAFKKTLEKRDLSLGN